MITIDKIRYDLANSPIGSVQYIGLAPHPSGDITKQVYTASLFARDKATIEKLVEDYKQFGWSPWIVGTMEDIPAAYLYFEVSKIGPDNLKKLIEFEKRNL